MGNLCYMQEGNLRYTMNAALLAYKKLAKLFRAWGFKMNPYDACVWNKMVNGKQFTIVFHIDDLLLSHLNPNIITLYGEFPLIAAF
jgi:hypothetical protein